MHSMNLQASSRSAGFTLVELLVVVGIIGVLTAVAVPAALGARSRANSSKDLSNMRQIGQGLALYAGENDGKLPPSSCFLETEEEMQRSWINALKAYLGERYDELRVSPSDPFQATRRQFQNTSYVINDEVDTRMSIMQRIDAPSSRILLFLASDNKDPRGQEDHIHGAYMGSWDRMLGEIKPDAYSGNKGNRTRGSSPYLFADFHAEIIPAVQIKTLADRGVNIARAPVTN
jgi:prepilin-type N-terminal cleavage/methylation domain-containing protein